MRAVRYIKPRKLRIMLYAFMGTGIFGILVGTGVFGVLSEFYNASFYVTFLGTINLCLGGIIGWIYLNQAPKRRDPRKPPRN